MAGLLVNKFHVTMSLVTLTWHILSFDQRWSPDMERGGKHIECVNMQQQTVNRADVWTRGYEVFTVIHQHVTLVVCPKNFQYVRYTRS